VTRRLRALAVAERSQALGELIAEPERLVGRGRRGRLPYAHALRLARTSARARVALRARVAERIRATRGRAALDSLLGLRHARRKPLLLAVSGMDGSGKSSATEALRARLHRAGVPAVVSWSRFAGDTEILDSVAIPVKRLLRQRATVADPVAAGGGSGARTPRANRSTSGLLARAWVLFLALLSARQLRGAARLRRTGTAVICDRWLADALVDMRVRYGRHRLAERVLSVATPDPDLAVLLEVDSETALARNADDQAGWVLADMERRYEDVARGLGLLRLDARRSKDIVAADLVQATEEVLAVGSRPGGATSLRAVEERGDRHHEDLEV